MLGISAGNRNGDWPLVGCGLRQFLEISFKGVSLDVQQAVVGKHSQGVPGNNVLTGPNGDFLNVGTGDQYRGVRHCQHVPERESSST